MHVDGDLPSVHPRARSRASVQKLDCIPVVNTSSTLFRVSSIVFATFQCLRSVLAPRYTPSMNIRLVYYGIKTITSRYLATSGPGTGKRLTDIEAAKRGSEREVETSIN